ncbi:MAG: hypothetical protein ACR2RV_04005 [Verrucomicrobiales bacterium]
MASDDSFGAMIKRAFKWHWHLLGLGAGVAVGFLSGKPDVVLPLVAAGEMAYLGFLGTNARFQRVLKGEEIQKERGAFATEATPGSATRLQELMNFLSPTDIQRFNKLRQRCSELMRLQNRMRSERGLSTSGPESFQTASLDKLLWLFLKLLHHKTGIDRFLHSTDRDKLARDYTEAQRQLEAARTGGRSERLIESLAEKAETIGHRIRNYDEAVDNADLIRAELDKTEQKITHICEVGMTSNDATDLSARIDGVTSSIATSERALEGLDLADILGDDLSPPPLIDSEETETISWVNETEMN